MRLPRRNHPYISGWITNYVNKSKGHDLTHTLTKIVARVLNWDTALGLKSLYACLLAEGRAFVIHYTLSLSFSSRASVTSIQTHKDAICCPLSYLPPPCTVLSHNWRSSCYADTCVKHTMLFTLLSVPAWSGTTTGTIAKCACSRGTIWTLSIVGLLVVDPLVNGSISPILTSFFFHFKRATISVLSLLSKPPWLGMSVGYWLATSWGQSSTYIGFPVLLLLAWSVVPDFDICPVWSCLDLASINSYKLTTVKSYTTTWLAYNEFYDNK